MLVYLGICAVVSFLAAVAAAVFAASILTQTGFAVLPAPTFHIAFAVGAMPLVFGAIIHFVPVLTRTGAPAATIHMLPLAVQAAGSIVVLALAGIVPQSGLHAAATVTGIAALTLGAWIVGRLRATLGAPHPGARWYVAALAMLLLAVAVVPPLLAKPEWRAALRLFHIHLNTLGFIGLAALGTLPVLLPTALSATARTEPTKAGTVAGTVAGTTAAAAARLRGDLWLAAPGALLLATGAAFMWPAVGGAGALLLAGVALRYLFFWHRAHGWAAIVGDGATAPLAAATLGFALLLTFGLAHGAGLIEARPAIAAHAAMFLLPLVTGALTQLLPVWRHPGADSPARRAMRGRLARGGPARALLFLVGGCLLALDIAAGGILAVFALLLFGAALIHALTAASAGPA